VVRDRTKLLHQSQPIKESPELRDLTRNDTVEDETGYGYLSSGWGNPLKLALVRTPTRPALGHSGPFDDHLVGRVMPVGESASYAGCKGFEVLETNLPSPREKDRCVGSHEFVRCRQIPFVPELLVKKSHQGLVLFT